MGRLSTLFGIVGLLLAAVGLYGVLSYAVSRRTGEIGIRKALGAPEQALVLMIIRETGWLLTIGFGAGLALTVATIRLISSRLYGLAPTDPATLVSAILLLAAVALLAAGVPAYRASRIDTACSPALRVAICPYPHYLVGRSVNPNLSGSQKASGNRFGCLRVVVEPRCTRDHGQS